MVTVMHTIHIALNTWHYCMRTPSHVWHYCTSFTVMASGQKLILGPGCEESFNMFLAFLRQQDLWSSSKEGRG